MNIAAISIRYRLFVTVCVLTAVLAGVWSYKTMGRLEDPEFAIKEALVVTTYPGASALEVAEEVTDEIETAVQQMGQLDRVTSQSEPGRSTVTVVIRDEYTSADLPQVWDELRRRINDVQRFLPPGAQTSIVFDDYGDVFGVFYAIYGDGFDYAQLEDHAKTLRRELLLIPDVGKIDLAGVQEEVVYVEFSRERIASLGLSPDLLFAALEGQNLATPAGRIRSGDRHIRLEPTGQFTSVEDIENLLIINPAQPGSRLYLRDIATVTRGYTDPPRMLMKYNGRPAVGLAISTVAGGNVVRMGEAIAVRMRELEEQTPIGIEIGLIAHQADEVNTAVAGFVVSLFQAVAIVVIVLMLAMGLRSGVIIGLVIALTMFGTFLLMKLTGVMIERVSLGALIIALGMLTDNAIVIVDGMLVYIRKGMDRVEAANKIVKQTMMPLLGATVIAVLAFAAIGLSQDRTGEYTRSLFLVLLYSLGLSWVLAITVTPVLCYWLLPTPKDGGSDDEYSGRVFTGYRGFVGLCMRFRFTTMAVLLVSLVLSIWGFGYVTRSFFPPSTRPQFMVHFWQPQGSHIESTERVALAIDEHVRTLEGVTGVASFVGAGSPRFLLTYSPEKSNPAYSMLLISVEDASYIDGLREQIESYVAENHADTFALVRRFALGPADLQKIHIRIRGAEADVIQTIREQVLAELTADYDVVDIRDDWRERVPLVRPNVQEMQARDAGLTRRDIATAMRFQTDGVPVGVYREGDTLLPIVARPPASERAAIIDVRDAQIWSPVARQRIPMRQVVGDFAVDSEFTMIQRRDRLPTLTIQADAASDNASAAVDRLMPRIAEIPLPAGYSIEWGGEYENSARAQSAIFGNFPPVMLLMALTVIALFNALRPPLIAFLIVPLSIVGVTAGLLMTNQPFGFMALLGFMSLSGMLIKNAIVLLDETQVRLANTPSRFDAVREAGVSRLRPVGLAAFTTVLGMIPLLGDAFFVAMAVTIMAGLTFATVLTLVVVPVLYAIFYNIKPGEAPRPNIA